MASKKQKKTGEQSKTCILILQKTASTNKHLQNIECHRQNEAAQICRMRFTHHQVRGDLHHVGQQLKGLLRWQSPHRLVSRDGLPSGSFQPLQRLCLWGPTRRGGPEGGPVRLLCRASKTCWWDRGGSVMVEILCPVRRRCAWNLQSLKVLARTNAQTHTLYFLRRSSKVGSGRIQCRPSVCLFVWARRMSVLRATGNWARLGVKLADPFLPIFWHIFAPPES